MTRRDGALGRSARIGRASFLLLCSPLAVGCAPCATTDVGALVAQWRSTLAAELPVGSRVEAVQDFLASQGLEATYAQATRAVVAELEVPEADSRVQCSLVSSRIEIACQFSEAGLLRACSTQAIHTGP